MDDLVLEFITETNESLDELDVDIVNLEQNPNDKDLLSKIFRLMHTIKGTCGFLGLPRLEKVAHHAENVLGRFRDGDLEVTPEYVTLIFESIDRIKIIVASIEKTGTEEQGDDSELIAKLDKVYESDGSSAVDLDDSAPGAESTETETESQAEAKDEISDAEKAAKIDAELAAAFGEPIKAGDSPAPAAAPPTPPAKEEKAEEPAAKETPSTSAPQTLRVNVEVLENLMTLVSELVLTRNQLMQILRVQTSTDFTAPVQRLSHVVSDLQDGVMKTRMQPIGAAWAKLPRIIRDLSLELGKKINLEMRGEETELDRQVLEMIKDPLTHMVRNSGDHGIETPADRLAAGKEEQGTILLEAFHEGGHIIIKISDDGKGLSVDKIKSKILEKNLVSSEELANMSDQQIQQFIFAAGFSTAEKVTSVSGRGVGMDVVRTNIEKIGGSIELTSTEGKGSTFTIKIPLTLAIVSALIVEATKERFAIPQLSVRELVMISEKSENRIEIIKDTPVLRLRDRLLPLVSLSDLLKIQTLHPELASSSALSFIKKQNKQAQAPAPKIEEPAPAIDLEPTQNKTTEAESTAPTEEKTTPAVANENENRNAYVVVTQVGTYTFGIIVDRVFDTEEIVVKPVPSILKDIDMFSGNTILGDGSVIMILDPNGIAKYTSEVKSDNDDNLSNRSEIQSGKRKTSLLLFRAADKAPKAVPLALVSRLENIELEKIEYSGGRMMIQYRDSLIPLLTFDSSTQIGTEGEKPCLVFSSSGDKLMGLIVDEIVDIKEEYIDIQLSGTKAGLMGSAIIANKATDIIDIGHYLSQADNNWFGNEHTPYQKDDDNKAGGTRSKYRVLLIDDSAFFRNMLSPVLTAAGYDVTTMCNPVEALELCDQKAMFDAIISDIEMPEMDGLEFAAHIRAETPWKNIPLIALTSHATQKDIDNGKAAGFNEYVAKFERDRLITVLRALITDYSTSSSQEQTA